MQVTLLGTGDTAGTPVPGCGCETCDRARELGVERTRFSVHVYEEQTDSSLLVDFSPDFRQQFLRESVPLPDAGVVTHVHYDHLGGLGNVYRVVDELPVLAAGAVDPATGESVAATVRSRYDYLDAIDVEPVEPAEPAAVCGLEVTLVPVDHPPLASYGLRVDDRESGATLAITGDTTYDVPEPSRSILADADLLLADAIAPASFCDRHPAGGDHHADDGTPRTFGTKHATKRGALDLADELDAEEVRLVHCSHHFPAATAFDAPLAVDGEYFEL